MPKAMTLNLHVSGALGDFVAANVGANGVYEIVSEYVRDLIRRDMTRTDQEAFDRLNAELARAFARQDKDCPALTATSVIARNQRGVLQRP